MLDIFTHCQVKYAVWIISFKPDIEKRRKSHHLHQGAEDSEGQMPPVSGVKNGKGSKVAKKGCKMW
jgi:hypothetical protein